MSGDVKTYRQDTAPTNANDNDIWLDSFGSLHVWNSDKWLLMHVPHQTNSTYGQIICGFCGSPLLSVKNTCPTCPERNRKYQSEGFTDVL